VERVKELNLRVYNNRSSDRDGRQEKGEEMARNFGVPQTSHHTVRGSLWPLMLMAFVLTGIINVAVHLR
jgi:hypothetical protein